ncbi:MAG: MBL fold metallo-hydrolase [Candidatus Marinimicrobia bacterium]|nr:MBL fold metallo-hydrolase [Candidatus Neomarinimicrobiota bacterium]MCF7829464.1 MBL fold metallo-hydrolase [Candidatus Neomarinimicrobiota bacterium]MCF7882343.1 MBL fold metallo-hydrolase [Candidatus Neomarinimicrobiota bacterium]
MQVKFWGVRGSIATPGPGTVKYGGNTSCVELEVDGNHFVLDAGTGIRLLGLDLLKRQSSGTLNLMISHHHWDHIQGLPFFLPAFRKEYELNIFGYESTNQELEKIIANQMDPTYFPVQLGDLDANLGFHKVEEGTFRIGDVRIDTIFLNHPGYNMAYRFNWKGKTVVYATDNQPFGHCHHLGEWATEEYFHAIKQKSFKHIELHFDDLNERIIDFAKDVDLLIHDTQYTPEEFQRKIDWGHSSYEFTAELAIRANVKSLVLFHHEPLHSDDMVKQIETQTIGILKRAGHDIPCRAAREGLEVLV